MKTLSFNVNQEQYNALAALAYRIADNQYMIERYTREEIQNELAENHKCIMDLFNKLDSLFVPYWLQNSVICFFENWRNYKQYSIADFFKSQKHYNVTFSASVL